MKEEVKSTSPVFVHIPLEDLQKGSEEAFFLWIERNKERIQQILGIHGN